MTNGIDFIQDLAVVLIIAGVAGAVCRAIGLSAVVGYLVAGVIIGPYTPPFVLVTDSDRIHTLSQVGLVFLMFGIGLGLSLTKMRAMGATVLVATALGAFIILNLTAWGARAAGWSDLQGVFVATLLMTSSSAVIAKVMQELKLQHTRSGQLALSVTVLEDIVAVVMLAILGARTGLASTPGNIGALLTGLTAFVVLLLMAGLFFVPRLLRRFDRPGDPELQTIVIAGLMFLMALLAVKAGYSLALGAFLLGAIVAETPQHRSVNRAFSGARDMFSSVFFVSIGMLMDIRLLLAAWPWVLGLTVFALVVRPLATSTALILVGTPARVARLAGFALFPLGEFSFLVAQLGTDTGVLDSRFYPMAVGASILTVLLMPVLNRRAPAIVDAIERVEPRWLQRAWEAYGSWCQQLGRGKSRGLWWPLSRKRFGQIAAEMLLVTGLLAFSERMLDALQESRWLALDPATLSVAFWIAIGIVALIPLVAIGRNLAALAMIFGEAVSTGTRVPARAAATSFQTVGGLALAYWLLLIVPGYHLPFWGWGIIAVVLLLVLALLYRRLIRWHSEWQYSLEHALGGGERETNRTPAWTRSSKDWPLSIEEVLVPEGCGLSGRTIGDLAFRSRFGCTIAEIDRQGHVIIAPAPTERLYSGDRLLLFGEKTALGKARDELCMVSQSTDADVQEAVLEVIPVIGGAHVDMTLAELQIPRHCRVLLVGIERGAQRLMNLAGSEKILTGDQLLVLGTPRRLQRFREWLEA